jgi:hypothetical protein
MGSGNSSSTVNTPKTLRFRFIPWGGMCVCALEPANLFTLCLVAVVVKGNNKSHIRFSCFNQSRREGETVKWQGQRKQKKLYKVHDLSASLCLSLSLTNQRWFSLPFPVSTPTLLIECDRFFRCCIISFGVGWCKTTGKRRDKWNERQN